MLPTTAFPKLPPNLKGVKHSRTSNTTSLGLDCLDKLIEDGIPFPSIILINEKSSRKIGKILQRIYCAEAIVQEQNVIVASPRKMDLEDILNSIPSETTSSGNMTASGISQKASNEESLKIAWRFQSAPKINSSISNSKPKFDLAKSKARMEINESELVQTIFANTYQQLWKELEGILNCPNVDITQSGPKNAFRIILSELGSPLFLDHSKAAITNFITRLRAFIMSSCATVMICIDGDQMDTEMFESFHLISDSILNFYPIPEHLRNANDPSAFTGRLEVAKIPRLYGNNLFRPEFCDYSYKDTRHTLEIRKFLLDFDDSNEMDTKSLEPITDDLREMGILAPDIDDV
uniref:Elongator complex protein 4 n=1 Tax=Panagrolaimus superbus TaxID=310955 RepID=A0A914Y920_9BILA